jgi:hypothetical protein
MQVQTSTDILERFLDDDEINRHALLSPKSALAPGQCQHPLQIFWIPLLGVALCSLCTISIGISPLVGDGLIMKLRTQIPPYFQPLLTQISQRQEHTTSERQRENLLDAFLCFPVS